MSTVYIEMVKEVNPDAIVLEGLDEALVGVGSAFDLDAPRLVYSISTIINILTERDGMSEEEAAEFFDYNIKGGYFGTHTPLFLNEEKR